ncbi:MAG: FAD-dependent oxidoreductase [Thermoanaerobaculales bacterium]|jgi:NADPH-dependent 2,4-dienoyl-CoA reductase/sulfur reductase-like enzyme|nr:FAD-dependent oxidoreductase [Thermoanaerobaculales bacterium]
MKEFDIVVIGGGPAGFATAMSARKTYPDKTLALIRKEETALIPCGIPYTMNRLEEVDDDILPDAPLEAAGIDIIIDTVVGRNGRRLQCAGGEEIRFERLVVATGSIPMVPPIRGLDKGGVFTVIKEMSALRTLKKAANQANDIVVIGGGYVGVEFADELLAKGKRVTIIDRLDHLLPQALDPEFCAFIEAAIADRGGELRLGTSVTDIKGGEHVEAVLLDNGQRLTCDLVIMAVGFKPNHSIGAKLGIEVSPGHGIKVDEYMRTSSPGIFAVGDCAEQHNCYTGENWPIMLASTAMAQGRLAGSNLYSIKVVKTFQGVLGTFSSKIGGTAVGVSGLTEVQAQRMGLEYVVGRARVPDRHPGTLDDVSIIEIKLLFSRFCHTLLGGQIKGGDSVGEMANILAVMIQNEMTDMEIDTLQIGTHPLLTSSPVVYPIITATVDAISNWFGND